MEGREPGSRRRRRTHVQQRIRERYGLTLWPRDVEALLGMIRDGVAVPLKRKGHRTLYLVEHRDEFATIDIRVVYDARDDELVTALSPGMVF